MLLAEITIISQGQIFSPRDQNILHKVCLFLGEEELYVAEFTISIPHHKKTPREALLCLGELKFLFKMFPLRKQPAVISRGIAV